MLSEMVERRRWNPTLRKRLRTIVEFNAGHGCSRDVGCDDKKLPLGLLALVRDGRNPISAGGRRKRIGRYVVALIEDVIARDYDSLTGLMSWSCSRNNLLKSASAARTVICYCLYFDIDQMHVINETFRRDEAGDEILVSFARNCCVNGSVRASDDADYGRPLYGPDGRHVDIDSAREHAEGNQPAFSMSSSTCGAIRP